MGEFVLHHFSWDRRGKAFPSSPLPKNFRTLCSDFELVVAKQVAKNYGLPELPQVIFYAMLLYEAERPGVLDRVYEARFCQRVAREKMRRPTVRERARGERSVLVRVVSMTFPPIHNTREMANYVRETFIWRWRSISRPPHLLPEDFHMLCPRFSLVEAKGAAAEFELPEIVQVTFYAILLNEAFELGVAHKYTAESMKSSMVGLRWSTFEVWLNYMDEVIRGAQLYRPPDEVEVQGARDGQGEGSGSAGPPVPSSEEE
ncbi:hypothetical protein Cgig2_007585 [Carnegiea gigantea]|uniref:Uncharacterized protein n=1 Tax=Carnegiea gigantea TaxID=171969 RepID=A0A9Q1QAP7_9CARY|nr:hypothetical protein Cgig2_007585 [Carnegiea gigantea]